MRYINHIFPVALLFTGACSDVEGDGHDHDHEHEVITTVELTFTPQTGGDAVVATWADREDDGNPVVDDIVLNILDAEVYDLSVSFWNELEDPAEDVTPEIADEADEHQVFFTGTSVEGPATGTNASAFVAHSYADEDAGGLPLGLANTFTVLGVGSGELQVTLRHLPPEDGSPVKLADLADAVASSGFGAIGGDNDVQIEFYIEVQ